MSIVSSPNKLKRALFLFTHCLAVLLLCSFELALPAQGESSKSKWDVPLKTLQWKPLIQSVRTAERPNRLVGIADEDQSKGATLYSVRENGGGVTFDVVGNVTQNRTMKWEADIYQKEIGSSNYYLIKYKATGVRRIQGRYPLVSVSGNDTSANRVAVTLLDCAQAINDGQWHIVIGKTDIKFPLNKINIELSTTDSKVALTIDSLYFSSRMPQSPAAFVHRTGARASRDLKPLNLKRYYNDRQSKIVQTLLDKYGNIVDGGVRFGSEHISVDDVPFSVVVDGNNIVRTPERPEVNKEKVEFLGEQVERGIFFPVGRDDKIEISVGKKVSELFFILQAEFSPTVKCAGFGDIPFMFNDIGMFAVELVYADGESDLAFPYSMADKGFIIQRMTAAYAVPADENRKLKSVIFHNRFFGTNINLAAVTLNVSSKRKLPVLVKEPEVIRVPKPAQPPFRKPDMEKKGHRIMCGNTYYDLVINCSDGFAVEKIRNRWSVDTDIELDALSGMEVVSNNKILDQADFETETVSVSGKTATVIFKSRNESIPLRFALNIAVDDSPEISINMEVENSGQNKINATIKFPLLKGISIGKKEDTWIFFPQCRNIISNKNGFHRSYNDQGFPMQFYDIYNPRAGIGLALVTHNLTNAPIDYSLSKSGNGVQAFVEYPGEYYTLDPGDTMELVETTIVPHAGDWHQAMAIYKEWVGSWYNPPQQTQNRDWFNNAFVVRTDHTVEGWARGISKTPPLVDPESGEYILGEGLEADKKYNGFYPDIFHFWWHAYGEWGDWDYKAAGGLTALKAAVDNLQNDYKIPASLYFLMDRCTKTSQAGRKIGAKVTRRKVDGSAMQNDKLWYSCLGSKVWTDYSVETIQRVQKETGVMAVYLDVFPVWRVRPCYSTGHGHKSPYWANEVTNKFVKRVRDALPDETALWSEFNLPDLSSQYVDGNITYYAIKAHELFAKSDDIDRRAALSYQPSISIYRYVFPHIKQFAITWGNERAINKVNRLKFPFFNGEGYEDSTWRLFPDVERDLLEKCLALKKRYLDCFTSKNPAPLVETGRANVYANKFPGDRRTVWTLYNGRYTTVRGKIIAVEHQQGATYYDAWNGKELEPEIIGEKAILSLKLGPQGLGCIVQSQLK